MKNILFLLVHYNITQGRGFETQRSRNCFYLKIYFCLRKLHVQNDSTWNEYAQNHKPRLSVRWRSPQQSTDGLSNYEELKLFNLSELCKCRSFVGPFQPTRLPSKNKMAQQKTRVPSKNKIAKQKTRLPSSKDDGSPAN